VSTNADNEYAGTRQPAAGAAPDLAARAARLHFEFGLTQQETAETLGLSRVKVTRLLKRAREAGLVRVIVDTDVAPYGPVEEKLSSTFGLREALVVPSGPTSRANARELVARGAAGYLERVLRADMTVAIGLSRTVATTPQFLIQPRATKAHFVSLAGAPPGGGIESGSPYEATAAFAAAFRGTAEYLHAPVIVNSRNMGEQLRRDPAIAHTLDRARSADLAFVGVGGRDDRLDLISGGYLSEREWQGLLDGGAVGDIGARFFDANGQAVLHPLGGRVIGLSLEDFARIPTRLVAAAGSGKVLALRAALSAGLITVLVTDLDTANQLLGSPQAVT
jgi:DNA-binding transcriptional regulator LsrR (DeoR family)